MRIRCKAVVIALVLSGRLITAPASLARQAAPAPSKSGNLKSDPEAQIYKQLRSGDEKQRQAAIDQLRRIVDAQPGQMSRDIEKWIKPLTEAGFHKEILQLTEEINLVKAADSGIMSDIQQARVKALLASGEKERALSEAKGAFNVAGWRATVAASRLLAEAMRQTLAVQDLTIIERLAADQEPTGAVGMSIAKPPVLKLVSVDESPFKSLISTLSTRDDYQSLMARGNLLLLADRGREAQDSFLSALRSPQAKGRRRTAAAEGVLRAMRAQDGSVRRANWLLASWWVGETTDGLAQVAAAQFGDMQAAAQQLGAVDVGLLVDAIRNGDDKPNLAASDAANSPVATPDPLDIARAGSNPDPALVEWIGKTRQSWAKAKAVSSAELADIELMLRQTTASAVQLFALARSLHQKSPDDLTLASRFYEGASRMAHAELSEPAPPDRRLALLRMMHDTMPDYKKVLWPRIEKYDSDSNSCLYRIYTDFAQHAPRAGDAALAEAVLHTRIGAAGCLYVRGQSEEALALLNEFAGDPMQPGENLAFQWVHGLVLYQLSRYAEAAAAFREVVATENPQARDAWPMLVKSLSRGGDRIAAREAFEKWQRDFHPSDEQAREARQWIDR